MPGPGSPREKFVRASSDWLRTLRPLGRLLFERTPFYLAAALAPAATSSRTQAGSGRGVAQPGRALSSGGRGRRFESSLPDHWPLRASRRMSSRRSPARPSLYHYLNLNSLNLGPWAVSLDACVQARDPAGLRARRAMGGPGRCRPDPSLHRRRVRNQRRRSPCRRRRREKLGRRRLRQAALGQRRRFSSPARSSAMSAWSGSRNSPGRSARSSSARSRAANAPRRASARPI